MTLVMMLARDENKHIVGSSKPDVIIGSGKDLNRGCRRKDKDHMEFLCEVYAAQSPLRARADIRSKFGKDVSDADQGHARNKNTCGRLVHFWLAACDGGGPALSTRACGRSPMNDKLGCGYKDNAQATQARRWNNQEHGYIKLPEERRSS